MLLEDKSFPLFLLDCVPFAHVAEPVICCHLQTSLSSSSLACSLLSPSFLFSSPYHSSSSLLVGFQLCNLNQQPAAPSHTVIYHIPHAKLKFVTTPDKAVVCWLADVCTLVCRCLTVSLSALTGNWLKNEKMLLEQLGRK